MTSAPPSWQRDYEALRDGAGFVELPGWTSVTFAGKDRQTFLNNFCTNEVKKLTAGQSCEAFITNVKGRTIGYGLVDCRADEVAFITVPGQAAALLPHFDRYIIREDVQLSDTSAARAYFYFGADPQLPIGRWIAWDLLGRVTGGLLEVATEVAELIHGAEVAGDYSKCDLPAFEALRIEAGTPLFGMDFNDSNLPQEIGRDRQAISFTKGCYLGQETVARIDALGHVNQQLAGVRFDGSSLPAPGVELQKDGVTVGRVMSATFSPQLDAPLALAMVRRETNAVGTRIESADGAAEVVKLPVGGR